MNRNAKLNSDLTAINIWYIINRFNIKVMNVISIFAFDDILLIEMLIIYKYFLIDVIIKWNFQLNLPYTKLQRVFILIFLFLIDIYDV